jgi:hypothetical protein
MKNLKQLFRSSLVAENREAISSIWVGDQNRAVLMNPDSTKVYASLWHDGYGKFYPTIYASLFAARRIHARELVTSLRLRNFPCCALELVRFKFASMDDAQECLQELLVELQMI